MSAGLTLRGDIPADEAEIIAFLHNVRRCMLELLALEFDDAPILTSLSAVVDYLRLAIAHERTEQLRALFLRSDGRLIVDEILSRGGARRTAALPSQIIRRALELGSSSLLLAHNHPSGDHSPSAADIATTRQIADLARQLDVELYDHLIISKTGWTSLRAEGLL
jgi:DNA repair protein RadC